MAVKKYLNVFGCYKRDYSIYVQIHNNNATHMIWQKVQNEVRLIQTGFLSFPQQLFPASSW